MKKVQVKQGIHKVSDNNVRVIRQTRHEYARRQFNDLIKDSKHMAIIALDADNMHKMYSTMDTKELIFTLETCKAMLLNSVQADSADII